MKTVYDKIGGYTEEAVNIANEVRRKLESLIREELEKGTPIEALEYVLCGQIHTEILKQSLALRLGK